MKASRQETKKKKKVNSRDTNLGEMVLKKKKGITKSTSVPSCHFIFMNL